MLTLVFSDNTMKRLLVLLIVKLVFMGCVSKTVEPQVGYLEIKATISPLCPVEPCNRTVDDIRRIYESYSFILQTGSTKQQILEQKLNYNGTNGILKVSDLPIGEYQLEISPKTIFTNRVFPKTFVIENSKVTTLQIDIDTGIR